MKDTTRGTAAVALLPPDATPKQLRASCTHSGDEAHLDLNMK
jgi:hypothetical protein